MAKSFFRRISKNFFVITNIVIACCFLIGCYGNSFVPSSWWFVGLFSMAAFYLLLILIIFIVFWLFAKPFCTIISIITITLAYNPINQIVPFRLSSDFSMEKQASNIRIMSWNVAQFDILYNKQRPDIRDKMIDVINSYKPDIACFQEMVAADTLVNLNTAYYKKYSFFSVFEYASKLSMPAYYFSYNFKEDFLNHQHFGLMIFSKYPIINKQTISNYPYDYNNNFQFVDIVKGIDTIRVFNIHLQSLKFTPVNLEYIEKPTLESKQDLSKTKSLLSKLKTGFLKRHLQANAVKAAIDKSPFPVIVCGDFNDIPNSYAYLKIGEGLQNAFAKKGSGLGRTFSGIAPTLRIDNIFLHPTFVIKQFKRDAKKLSDHFPVITDFSVNK